MLSKNRNGKKLLLKNRRHKMVLEEALIQGVTSGGTSAVMLYAFAKYILPRMDKFQTSLDKIETKIDLFAPMRKKAQKKLN